LQQSAIIVPSTACFKEFFAPFKNLIFCFAPFGFSALFPALQTPLKFAYIAATRAFKAVLKAF